MPTPPIKLTEEEQDRLLVSIIPGGSDCAHNMVPLYNEVERILNDRLNDKSGPTA